MLDARLVDWSTSMRMYDEVRPIDHAYEVFYEHDYALKSDLSVAVLAEEPEDAEESILRELLVAFPGFSLDVIAAAYTEAESDPNLAAEILTTGRAAKQGLQCSTMQEVPKIHNPNRNQNGYARHSIDEPKGGSDELLLQKYGIGVGNRISSDSSHRQNIQHNHLHPLPSDSTVLETSSYTHDASSQSSNSWTSSTSRGSSLGRSLSGRESYEANGNVLLQTGKTKKKKKRKGEAIAFEGLEPKDAASRQAVEEFLLSMLGEGFQLENDVVRDVLGYFEGDTQKSLEMLLQIASSSSGMGTTSDNSKGGRGTTSQFDDKMLDSWADPLHALMEAFPDRDPMQVGMAFQEHNGNVEKVSNALLKNGEWTSMRYTNQEAMINERMEQNHSGVKLLLDQLKASFPTVDHSFLFEGLQSTNFVRRDAERVLLEAGSTTLYGHPEAGPSPTKVDQSNRPQKVLYKEKNKMDAAAHNQPLRALWANQTPVITSVPLEWTVVRSKVPLADSTDLDKRKPTHQLKSNVECDDYDHHRCSANEHWRTMQYYFTEAAAAYGRGERCRAATLSEKGKEYKMLAREAHDRASHRLFRSRNKDIENNITIDLHAQHVREAIQVLKLHLRTLSLVPSVHTLTVITGHGSHSSNGRARIKPCVTKFLSAKGIAWGEVNAGCLIIKMKIARDKELDSADHESPTDYE